MPSPTNTYYGIPSYPTPNSTLNLISTMLAKSTLITLLAAAAGFASASPIAERATCSSYTVIDTRGTGEPQGPSAGFRTMNSKIFSSVSGGTEYDTVYAAGFDQNSAQATSNIVAKSNPPSHPTLPHASSSKATPRVPLPPATLSPSSPVLHSTLLRV